MFEGTKVQIHKTENGYGVRREETCHDNGGIRVHVYNNFWRMVDHLRRQFGEEPEGATCGASPSTVPYELYREQEAKLDCALKELAGWRELHDNVPLERVRELKKQAQDFTRTIREHIAHNQGEEAAKRSEQARKAAQARHKKPAPRKR